ncbi:MAG: biotin-dependent carboxyltransferase family protein [Acetobacteraceae bacterium]|nr:biotin-dependent carboxyltransferase family protein [Acetobacteraceae bacterium]
MIEILSTGLLNTVQDLGRPGHLSIGVGRGGAMDRLALESGNALLGNPPDAAGLEIVHFPFRMRFEAETAFAVTGAACSPALDGGPALPPWWATTAKAGQVLTLTLPRAGARAYVCLAGGIDVPAVLGARGTDAKNGFGGLHGRGLSRGDQLALLPHEGGVAGAGFGAAPSVVLPRPGGEVWLRVLEAAETTAFTAASRQRFADEGWTLTAEANRMGFRLHGTPLERDNPAELFSHGIVPGTVQVPPAGLPMIQMADANTCGGYPKIATVIEADLGAMAQAPIGARFRFSWIDWSGALDALRQQAAFLADLRDTASLLRAARL